MAESRQKLTGDPVGSDVAERHRPVRIRIEIEYRTPRNGTRTRGGRIYVDDDPNRETRSYLLNLNADALDPARGPEVICTTLAQTLYKRLTFEGWPERQQASPVDVRPGAPGYGR